MAAGEPAATASTTATWPPCAAAEATAPATASTSAMPRFLRLEPRGSSTATMTTTTTKTPETTADNATPSSAEGEPSELSLSAELQRRKAAFLAHFGRFEDGLATAMAANAAAVANESASPSDWKCNVCNAPLRLLRLRVRLDCFVGGLLIRLVGG